MTDHQTTSQATDSTTPDKSAQQLHRDPDPPSEFEYDLGEQFTRHDPQTNSPREDIYTIVNISWRYKTNWLLSDAGSPAPTSPRVYTLLSEQTCERISVPEPELKHGNWRSLDSDQTG
jgi:hypothetical protein